MSYFYRVKCLVSIASNQINVIAPVAGFRDIPPDPNTTYLLEDTNGNWEIGKFSSYTSPRTVLDSSGDPYVGFGATNAGLTLSYIAPVEALIVFPEVDACAIGDTGNGYGGAPGAQGTSVGIKAHAAPFRSSALGFKSSAAHEGETALGHFMLPHTSVIPVCAVWASGAPTVWKLRTITDVDDYAYITEGAELVSGVMPPATAQGSEGFMIRVTGTLAATSQDGTRIRVFDIDYATYNGVVLYNASSIKSTTGTTAVVFGVATDLSLEVSVGAEIDLRVRGVLHADKIPFVL